MNILVFSDIESTGKWLATQDLIANLKKIKPELNFYLLAYGENKLSLDKTLFKTIEKIPRPPLIPPFKYYKQIILELINQVKSTRSLITHAGIKKVNLIITTEYSFLFSAKIAIPQSKLIFCFHGFKHYYKLGIKNFNFYMFLLKILERGGWLLSNAFVLPSENVKSVIQKELGILFNLIKFIVAPNIVPNFFKTKYSQNSLKEFKQKLGIPKNYKIILYVGRISEKKGLENLLRGFFLAKKVIKNLVFVLVYPSFKINQEVWNNLIKIIKPKNLQTSVHFLKDTPRENLPIIYQVADCAILASELEMNSLFLLECVFSRLPIFSTPVGNTISLSSNIDEFFILKNNYPATISKSLINFLSKPPSWRNKIKFRLELVSRNIEQQAVNDKILALFD